MRNAIQILALFVAASAQAAVSIYYAGGTLANTTITDDGTKQTIASGVEDCLNTAGWTTVTGHHSLPTTLESATGADANVGRIIMSAATNTLQFKIANHSGTLAPTQAFGFLFPTTTTIWGCTANQFGFIVRSVVGGNLIPARSVALAFVPDTSPLASLSTAVPSMFGLGMNSSDTDTGSPKTWRSANNGSNTHTNGQNGQGTGAWATFANNLAYGSSSTSPNPGFTVFQANAGFAANNGYDEFSDAAGSVNFSDALVSFQTAASTQPYLQGWLYGMVVVNANVCTLETNYTVDNHTFVAIASANSTAGTTQRDSVDNTYWCLFMQTCATGTSCSGN